MKHLNNLACMLAMLTAGSMGFTACSSDDVAGGGNTDSGVAGKMVKTSFALNIPYGSKSGRMTADNTQLGENPEFKGMQDMRLLAFGNEPSKSTKKIVLASGTEGAFDKDDSEPKRYIYRDVMIPIGTKSFLFYGKKDAKFTKTEPADLITEKFTIGSIVNPDLLTNTNSDAVAKSSLTFSLEKIHNTAFSASAQGSTAKVVADALNKVYAAKVEGDNGLEWKNCVTTATESHTPDAVEIHAANLFAQFKTLKAGSAASAIATLESLQKSCGRSTTKTGEENDILLAVAKACDEAKTEIETSAKKFPRDLGLPDGAAKGSFNASGNFVYDATGIPATTTGNSLGLDYTKVTYPAALNYFIETPVKASNKAIENLSTSNGWPSYTDWSNTAYNWGNDWEDEVGNNTRSIALKNVIQYAVAGLQTNVSISTATLKDNASRVGKLLADQEIDVSSKGFKLTGVLIGGQPTQVGYNYIPSQDDAFDYTIYDREMNEKDNSITSSSSTTNYTLVLDNSKTVGSDENMPSVYVTLELENNTGVDFYGADGLVPNGGKFYLIGELKVANINQGGNENNLKQVFKLDYKTVANMRIGAESLKKAYNTIPDLRSTQISLGLAVDLKWEKGITFTVDL